MSKFGLINLAKAEKMSEDELQLEIGKRAKYLREELGMDRFECANFVGDLLNIGVALNKIFESKHSFGERMA